jgi:hypothetical protein
MASRAERVDRASVVLLLLAGPPLLLFYVHWAFALAAATLVSVGIALHFLGVRLARRAATETARRVED